MVNLSRNIFVRVQITIHTLGFTSWKYFPAEISSSGWSILGEFWGEPKFWEVMGESTCLSLIKRQSALHLEKSNYSNNNNSNKESCARRSGSVNTIKRLPFIKRCFARLGLNEYKLVIKHISLNFQPKTGMQLNQSFWAEKH